MSAQPLHQSTGEVSESELAHRCVHLMRSVDLKVSKLRTQTPTVEEIILGTVAQRLSDIPVAEFDRAAAELDEHLKHAGCSVQRCHGDDVRLSDLAIQMGSIAELLEPYRPALKKLGGSK